MWGGYRRRTINIMDPIRKNQKASFRADISLCTGGYAKPSSGLI